jgi:hypothetical protein
MTTFSSGAAALLSVLLVLAPSPVLNQRIPTNPWATDPAVEAYLTFVKGKTLTQTGPVDREFGVAALDRLVSAIEGLALARDVATDTLLARAHEIRRDIRRLAENDSQTLEILKKKTDVFVAISELMSALSVALGPKRGAEPWRLDALQRSADGLDFEYPLKWQPGAIQGYLEIAAQVLQEMSTPLKSQKNAPGL